MIKVLLSAYACEPNRGSEPGVGWNWAIQAARFHEVWVVTRANNREVIEREMAENPRPTLRFIYHDLPKWARWWKRGSRGVNLYYLLWQLTAIPKARRWARELGFDVGHHVSLVSFRHPTFLAWVGIPFVWGPVGGGEEAPRAFYRTYGIAGSFRELVRAISNLYARYDPLVRIAARRASIVFVATPETKDMLPAGAHDKTRLVPAIGMSVQASPEVQDEASDNIRLLFVGNLIHLKGLQLAIPAVARAYSAEVPITFTIVGDGSYRRNLVELGERANISHILDFRGQLSYSDVQKLYLQHDIFVFPSLRDSGGFAVIEAMAAGLPVICLDLGGPAIAVTESTGIRVPAHNPDQAIADLSAAIVELANNKQLRREMGLAGIERARTTYNWQNKGSMMAQVYSELLESTT